MRQVVIPCLVVAISAIALSIGCGSADEHPLGGPYGGSGSDPNPSAGSGNTGSATDDGGGTPGDDGGSTQPPPGVDASPPPPGVDASPPPPGVDASPPPPQQDSGQPPPPAAPTWSQIYGKYFAGGTVGNCSSCHGQAGSASSLYSWMKGKGYISGTSSAIVSTQSSDISWFGGNMPPRGPSSNPAAVSDMKAWVAAGALNN